VLAIQFLSGTVLVKVDDDLVVRVKSACELIMIHDNLLSAHSIVFSGEDFSIMLKDLLVF